MDQQENTHGLLFPPTIVQEVVPYSDLMAPKYHSSILGPAFPAVANMIFWLMFFNFNVGIFNALPIGPLDGGQFYNSLIERKVNSKTETKKCIFSGYPRDDSGSNNVCICSMAYPLGVIKNIYDLFLAPLVNEEIKL